VAIGDPQTLNLDVVHLILPLAARYLADWPIMAATAAQPSRRWAASAAAAGALVYGVMKISHGSRGG
jgi:hypothetical protein